MMISQRIFNKVLLLFMVLFTIGGALAFPSSILGSVASSPPDSLTVAGQSRSCSEYADETGTFVGAKTISSSKLPALVNVYYVTSSGGWKYYGEFTAPVTINQGSFKMAYEVYYCPTQTATCGNGQVRAVTETSFQTCSSGQWGSIQTCPGLHYFSPQDAKCVPFECKEQWSCGQYGQCTASGSQYRSCTDSNRCGTYKDMPKTSQACSPTLSQGVSPSSSGGTSVTNAFGLKLIGQPRLDAYTTSTATARTVTQDFDVITPGQYWVEVGIEQLRGYDITASVTQNTCTPDEPWYANQLVTFNTAGKTSVTFTVTPGGDGEYVLHSAIVTGCGGEVIQQVNAADHLFVGDSNSGKTSLYGWLKAHVLLVSMSLAALLLVAGVILWARRR
jgi:hypothetical protein